MKKSSFAIPVSALLAGNLAYIVAVASSFNLLQLTRSNFTPATILLLTIIGGILAVTLGYASILILGGACSLGIANLVAKLTGSKHVIEYNNHSQKNKRQRLLANTYILYAAGIVFLLLVAIAWDLHNADGPRSGILYPLLNATNIFLTKTTTVNPIRFSVNNLPLLLTLTAIAGITPSLTLPYLRNFKITSVNSGPFHTNILFSIVGLVAGLSVILTLVGLIYKVLWASAARTVPSYHFILLVMVGFSLHYAAGSYMGRDRTERRIVKSLEKQSSKSRIFFGTVDVRPRQEVNCQPSVNIKFESCPADSRIVLERQCP
jgi:hypothetical protein